MKQVLQPRSAAAVVRDVPSPACPDGGVLVRTRFSVISAGTERSRVELSQKSLLGKARERPDLVRQVVDRARKEGIQATRSAVQQQLSQETPVGYSSAGVVIEVGARVRGLRPGDAVACAGGGHANHAEVVAVPRNLCAPVPNGVPLEEAAFSTIAAIALHAIRLAEVSVGDRVGVVGCGLVGQLACRLLQAAGARTFALDVDPERIADAKAGGADHGLVAEPAAVEEVEALTGGVGLDEVLVTAAAGSNEPLVLGAKLVRDRGSLVLVGAVPIEFPRAPLYDKELSFRVSRSYGPGRYDAEYEERGLDYPIGQVRWTEQRNLDAVLDLLARGRLRVGDLIEEAIPVARAVEAYGRLLGDAGTRPRGALVLSFPDSDATGPRPNASVSAPPPDERLADFPLPTTPKRRIEAGTPVRVGLIGAGGFASRILVPAFTAAGAVLETVGGGAGPSAEAAQRGLGFSRVAASVEAVLEDPAVDAVVIATRHASHAQLACAALDAGKHVFCEKPLVLTLEELEKVTEAAPASEGTLAVGFNRRFSPTLRRAVDFLQERQGRVLASYRVAAGRVPIDHWVHDLEQGGGRALGEGCHFVDALRFVAGSPIVSVHASGYGSPKLPTQSRDNLVITLDFANEAVGVITYVADGSPRLPKERLEAFSASRSVVLDDYSTLHLYDGSRTNSQRERHQAKGHREEVAAFLTGIRTGSEPVPLGEIVNVSAATLAIVQSLRTAAPVSVRTAWAHGPPES